MKIENLTSKEKDDVLRTLLHYMPQDIRRKLMVAHPVAYVAMAPHTGNAVRERVRQETLRMERVAMRYDF